MSTKSAASLPAGKYLYISQWGVQMPLSSTISDAYYVVSTSFSNGPDGSPSGVWLGLHSLTAPSCNPANNNEGATGAIGDILRVAEGATDPVSGARYSQKYPNGVTINGYYYGYQSWTSSNPCGSRAALAKYDSAFGAAARKITAQDAQYLDIKEWGIKIKLSDTSKLIYTIGGTPNGSSGNADSVVSWASLKLSDSVTTDDKCRALGYEVDQLTSGTNATKVGNYYYGFNGAFTPCGDSNADALRAKIVNTELQADAITAQN